jgi:hypothetical protein
MVAAWCGFERMSRLRDNRAMGLNGGARRKFLVAWMLGLSACNKVLIRHCFGCVKFVTIDADDTIPPTTWSRMIFTPGLAHPALVISLPARCNTHVAD